MNDKIKTLSKFLSYVLRHHPEEINLDLDKNGWAEVSLLIEKSKEYGKPLDHQTIEKIIRDGNKQRFMLSGDGQFIRAGYGHSIDVNLRMTPSIPPGELYHGTAKRNISSILTKGIHPGNRNFVHLSATKAEAQKVGSRHGSPTILVIDALGMSRSGYHFYQSESEASIWLTKNVPAKHVSQSLNA